MTTSSMHRLKRGALAKKVGVSSETIRYYEQQDLIESERDINGYRLFDQQAVERLAFIQRAQKVGFSLKEIRELLALEVEKGQHTCAEVKAITDAKQQEILQRMKELQRMYDALVVLNRRCCGGDHSAAHCTILSALADIPADNESLEQSQSCLSADMFQVE